jgi:hypothetical protein
MPQICGIIVLVQGGKRDNGKAAPHRTVRPARRADNIPEDWRSRTVLSVPVAGRILDLSRQGAYDAVGRGDLPAIRIGRKVVVPVAKLRRLLGELPPLDEAV